MNRWLVVISDLHASEGIREDFDNELEDHLVAFLDDFRRRDDPTELIINGDFLDFVQASPWSGTDLESTSAEDVPLCFTEAQSLQKFRAIHHAHHPMFTALAAFLAARPENRLVILPGNHDVDFFWPEVRQQVTSALHTGPEQLSFCLSRAYRPFDWLWIEHGHQYDPVNSFTVGDQECWSEDQRPVFAERARRGAKGSPVERLYECTGTRFMIRFLNRLDSRYPYVDNVKPFSRFVRIFGASALTLGWGPLDASLSVASMLAYLGQTLTGRRRDLMSVRAPGDSQGHPLAEWLQTSTKTEQREFAGKLRESGFSLGLPLDMLSERASDLERLATHLIDHPELVEDRGEKDPSLLGAAPGTLTLKEGFVANETEDLYDGAKAIAARENVRTVVMGHTHEPISRREGFAYFNTGSWTRYLRYADTEHTHPWRVLREKSYERFPYHLRYVQVPPGASEASMETWRERHKA